MNLPEQDKKPKGSLKQRAARLKTELPAIFLALKMKETPWTAKALAAITVGYALSPIDLIPDFIPVLGYLDDVLLLPALAALTLRLIPPAVMEECRAKVKNLWPDGHPQRWYYAVPIVLLWGLLLYFILRAVLR